MGAQRYELFRGIALESHAFYDFHKAACFHDIVIWVELFISKLYVLK